jgi:hypothetical protein
MERWRDGGSTMVVGCLDGSLLVDWRKAAAGNEKPLARVSLIPLIKASTCRMGC